MRENGGTFMFITLSVVVVQNFSCNTYYYDEREEREEGGGESQVSLKGRERKGKEHVTQS